MSFVHDAYKHMELNVKPLPRGGVELQWHCQSCGADGPDWMPPGRITDLIRQFWAHLKESHKLEPPKPECNITTRIGSFSYFCKKDVHAETEPHEFVTNVRHRDAV